MCHKTINGTSETNLKKHMQRHKQAYKDLIDSDFNSDESNSIKRLKLIQNLVEIVTINGRPFSYLLDSGFQKCISDKLRQLHLAGCGINLNDPHLLEVKTYIHNIASELRQKIKEEVKGKPVALMIDIATKNRRSVLGISIQYVFQGLPKIVPIGIKELVEESTGKNLAKTVAGTLAQYELNMGQVITCTTDNGSNMLTMTEELDYITKSSTTIANNNIEPMNVEDENSGLMDDLNIIDVLDEPEMSDDAVLDVIFDENSLYEEMLDEIVEELRVQHGNQTFYVESIRCAAHTLQLAVKDALERINPNIRNVIKLCSRVAKLLRCKRSKIELKKAGIETILPILDVLTRWSSTYLMVNEC